MGKQINVGLKFTADTGQAKASIQELQSLLNKISLEGAGTSKAAPLTEAKRIREAAEAAKELAYHLNNAYNTKTGKFDLSALDKSLKISKSNITELSTKLIGAGDTGQQAFLKLAQSISQADQPMLKVSNKLQDFAKVLRQTAKYQLSNNMIRGFTGAIQSAYHYAQNLNASLTDIRIVTGYNTDQMAKFAEQANKAAKALSTTTTDYTKGSLIYFQQGLGDEEVRERTETTIKMANVTGESTSKIADQLTAVWNNFADGSKELSYYADAMVALGAATASSSDEISEGVNKFAATAKTVGLSYEYATAALATVTARTRESADVVGNAYRTLFARIQGLNQGDTLDDGTTLNKYSSALDKVGVNIKTTSGELKGMDQIIDELGPKWQSLANDQKMALAQTVAGVRQYGQFMALMNNYDYFKENVQVVRDSTGTLEKQAEIYAESWKAAQKQVRAVAEGVYQDLIDDKFFISLNNGLADIISGLDAFIEKAGGLKTIIMALSGVILTNFSNKIPDAIKNVQYNFNILTKGSEKAYQNIIKSMEIATTNSLKEHKIDENSAYAQQLKDINQLTIAKNKLAKVEDQLSDSEAQKAKSDLSILQTQVEEITNLRYEVEGLEKSLSKQRTALANRDMSSSIKVKGTYFMGSEISELSDKKEKTSDLGISNNYDVAIKQVQEYSKALEMASKEIKLFSTSSQNLMFKAVDANDLNRSIKVFQGLDFEHPIGSVDSMVNSIQALNDTMIPTNQKLSLVKKEVQGLSSLINPTIQQVTGLDEAFKELDRASSVEELNKGIELLKSKLKSATIEGKDFEAVLKATNKDFQAYMQQKNDFQDKQSQLSELIKNKNQGFQDFNPNPNIDFSQKAGAYIGAITSATSSINMFIGAYRTLMNPDTSGLEKITSVFFSLASSGGMAIQAFKNLQILMTKLETSQLVGKFLVNKKGEAFSTILEGSNSILQNAMQKGSSSKKFDSLKKETREIIAATVAQQTKNKIDEEGAAAEIAKALAADGVTEAEAEATATEVAHNVSLQTQTKLLWANVKGWAAQNTAMLMSFAAIAALITVISIYNARRQEEIETASKNAQKAREEANANEEVLKSNTELVNSYQELYNKYKETQALYAKGKATSEDLITAQDSLKSSAEDVADTLGIQGSALDILSGKYEELSQKIQQSQLESISGAIEDESLALSSAGQNLATTTKYSNYSIFIGNRSKIPQEIQEKILNGEYNNLYAQRGGQSVSISNTTNSEKLAEAYESYQKLYEDLSKSMSSADFNTNKLAIGISKYLSDNKEAYELYKQSSSNLDNLRVQNSSWQSFGNIKNAYDISSAQDYKNYSDEMIKSLAEQMGIVDENSQEFKDLQKSVESYLGTIGNVKDFQIQSKAFDDISKKTGIAREELISYYDDLGDNKNLFFKIDFDTAQNEKEFDKQIALLQSLADRETIKVKLELISQTSDVIESGSTEEIIAWAKQMREVFGENFDLNEILAKSSDDLTTWITEQKTKLQNDLNVNRQQTIGETQQALNEAEQKYDDQKESYNQNKDLLFKQKDRLSQLQQMRADYDAAQRAGKSYDFDSQKVEGVTDLDSLDSNITEAKTSVENLQSLTSNYESLGNQIEKYKQQLQDLRDEQEIEDKLGWRDRLKEQAEAVGISYDSVQEYAKGLRVANKDLEDNIELSEEMSLAYLKTEKGAKKISDSYEDWDKAIKNSSKDIVQYLKTIDEIKDAYKQVFNTIDSKAIDNLSDEFLTSAETMGLMNKAITGSEQDWNNWEAYVLAEINNTSAVFNGMTEEMKSSMTELTTLAANLDFSGLVPGADIDDALFLAKLDEMIFSTADAAMAMSDNLSSVGVDAEIEPHTETVPASTKLTTQNGFLVGTDQNGGIINIPVSAQVQETDDAKTYTWYTLKGAKYNGRGVRPAAAAPAKRGGGGGGGSKKSASHADTKSFSDKERYHTIKNQIEDLNSAYDDLNKLKDRAFGKDRLKYMDSEISKTQELIDAQEEYLRQIKANLPTDKSIMEEAYNSYIGGPAIEYDASGNISNFDEIQDAMFEEYNRMAQKYTDDSDEWKVFEKKYELLEKYIKQYEETYDLARDEQSKLQELQNQKVDLQLEQVQYEVEIKLDIPDSQIKVLEYKLGRIDDDAFKALDAIELLSQKADNLKQQIAINKQGLNDVLALTMSAAEISQILAGNLEVLNKKTLTDNQVSAIKEYRDNLLDLNSQFDDLRKEIEDKVMSAFDAWKEKLDKGIASIDHYNTVLDDYKNIIDIVGKDTLGITDAFMTNLAQRTTDNAINKLRSVKSEYETIVKARDEASSKLADAEARKDKVSIDFWQQTLDAINEEVESSNEEMMQAWQDALESLATQFENTMNNLIDTFNKSVYALGGLDALSDDFSRQQENADLMLDDYQKIYELSKLSRDINKTIDDTDIISGKQKLKKLLGQINDLQEDGNEMSKYDLEYLQKTYDLRLAEIELEEAQRAKNTVRLQKDSEGNWSYIYTQSSDAIDSAQQKYEDALYAMQDLSSNYIDEMSEKLISTSKEMQEAIAAIRIQDYANIDDYYAAVKKVQDQYEEEMNTQQNELQKAIDNNKELYNTDWQNYHDATGYKISDLENFATTFKDTLLGTLLNSESDTANFTDILKNSVDGLTEGLLEASRQYYLNLEEAMNAAGTSTKQFADDASQAINQVISDSDKGTAAVKKMSEEMKTAFEDITDSVSSWQESYGMSMEKIIQANLNVIESFNSMLEALSIDPSDLEITYNVAKKMDSDAKKPDSFDTGGYTGNWGSSGRLAMLHSKELVLNESDTANMLTAVQITRAMLDTIDLNARQASFGLGNLVASGIRDDKSQTLQQEVKITAEFPNVQDHTEIEQAFNNLINQASQYANRK